MALFSQVLVVALGCGGSPQAGPLAETETWLRVGLDPVHEANLIEERLSLEGYRRRLRIDGGTHSSLAMERTETGETLVRVVTRAGVALGLEAPAETGLTSVGLVDLGADIDGDGREEVGVFADDPARARRCIAVVRIDERGRAQEMRLDTGPLGGDACIEGVEDIDGDAIPEALVVVRYPRLSAGTPPRVTVPYRAATWRPLVGGGARAFARRERQRRQEVLGSARERSDARQAYRVGVELAAIARFSGAPAEAQVAALDEAVEGLELSAVLAATVEAAREFIRRGWQEEGDQGLAR